MDLFTTQEESGIWVHLQCNKSPSFDFESRERQSSTSFVQNVQNCWALLAGQHLLELTGRARHMPGDSKQQISPPPTPKPLSHPDH
jgi:hypothetical protein